MMKMGFSLGKSYLDRGRIAPIEGFKEQRGESPELVLFLGTCERGGEAMVWRMSE